MDWILEHLNVILTVAGVIAYWLNQKHREKNGEPSDYDGDGVPENPGQRRDLDAQTRDGEDPEAAERVRRIQEEIRRKIAERRGQPAPEAPLPRPATVFDPFQPVFREEAAPAEPPPLRAPLEMDRHEAAKAEEAASLERQRQLAEQLATLEKQRREARRAAQATSELGNEAQPVESKTTRTTSVGSRGLAAELRDPKALRRAFVMREILDAPVGLR